MLAYIAGRLVASVPVLVGVSLAVFAMLFLVPGDPVRMMLAEFVTTPDQVARMRAQLHLDEPLLVQYGRFVGHAVQGDLGVSIRSRRPVAQEIRENLASTVTLAVAAMALAVGFGVGLGLLAALLPRSWVDLGAMLLALLGVSMPSFWLGLLLIVVFSLHLGWLPATGGGDLRHLVLPAVTLGAVASALIARLTRSSLLEVLGQDYVRTARAKGLHAKRILWVHVVRNSLVPLLSAAMPMLALLITGALFVEQFFAIPGAATTFLDAARTRDYPLLLGLTTGLAAIVLTANLVADILLALIDPRVRESGQT